MTTGADNPYTPPEAAEAAKERPRPRSPHLLRFLILAPLNLGVGALFGYAWVTEVMRDPDFKGVDNVHAVVFGLVALTGLVSGVGLLLRRRWGWYATVLMYFCLALHWIRHLFFAFVYGYTANWKSPALFFFLTAIALVVTVTRKARQAFSVKI